MRNNYEIRAQKFIMSIFPYVCDWSKVVMIRRGISLYNAEHPTRVISISSGISRVAIITSDYVIKIDYNSNTQFGNCESELENYQKACDAGFEKYFAKITRFCYRGIYFYIMPRIYNINEDDDDVYYRCDDNDFIDWLYDNLYDLHSGNYGWKNGHPVIFDYAANT